MGDLFRPKHPPLPVAGIDKLQEENMQLKAQLKKVVAERDALQKRLNMKKWVIDLAKAKKVNHGSDGRPEVRIDCPGCGEKHYLPVDDNGWKFNGDYDKPTLSPSLLVRSGHYASHHKGDNCWCTFNKKHPGEPNPFKCGVCHSFVTDGKIQFLSDCTHALAGQTVDLPEID